MAKPADDFLNDLAGRGLVSDEIVASLRRQVAKAAQPVASAALAKLLVEKGHLTATQAQKLLGGSTPATAGSSRSNAKPAWKTPASREELTPLDDLTPLDEPAALEALTSLDELTPLGDGPLAKPPEALTPLEDIAPLEDLGTAVVPIEEPLAGATMRAAPAPQPQPARAKSSIGWVLGGLTVLALVIAGAAGAYFLIPRGDGEKEFAAALQDYEAKAYDAAIAKYDAALAEYPRSSHAAAARVRRSVAKVLAAKSAAGSSWQPVLAAAKEALPPIAGESQLPEVQGDIAPLLMDMTVELAKVSEQGAATGEKVAAAREALALADDARFVPGPVRQWQRLDFAAEGVARAEHAANRSKSLEAAVAAIKKAQDAGDIQAAYQERVKLLSAYADLATDPDLRDLGPGVAAAAAAKVHAAPYASESQTSDAASSIVATIALQSPPGLATTPGPAVAISALGSAWALDSATGRLRWRRFTGGWAEAIPLGAAADSDCLLVDDVQGGLVRVARADGAIRWRQGTLGPLAGEPLVIGESIFMAARSGQLVSLAAQSGAGQHTAQLPQAARVSPVAAADGRHVIQAADHSLIYVLAAADLKCERAVFVGHETGGVAVPPTVLPKHLVVAENRGLASSVLHMLVLDDGGLPKGVVQRIDLVGHILAPPVVLEGRLAVVTDAGRLLVYESAADPADGMKEAARAEVGSAAGIVRHAVVHQGKLLVAGEGLRRLAPPAGGKLKEEWSVLSGDVLISPPHIVGDTVVAAAKRPGNAGVVVVGMNWADGQRIWETHLAQPIAAVTPNADGKVTIVSSSGDLAQLDLSKASGFISEQWKPSTGAANPGTVAPRTLPLPGPLASGPLNWRDGVVVVTATGEVAWLDPQSGGPKAQSLQLALRPGQRLADCRLAVVGEEHGEKSSELIVLESNRLTRVGLASEPASLTALASAQLQAPAISDLIVGDGIVGVLDRRGHLATFIIAELKSGESREFPAGATVAGPTRIGSSNFLASDRDELLCLDASLAQTWRVPLSRGPLAGDPAADSGGLLVATRSGWLSRLNRDTGQEIAQTDLGQPLVAGPIVVSPHIVVTAADGTLLVATLPAGKANEP